MKTKHSLTSKQRWWLGSAALGLVLLVSLIAVDASNEANPVVTIPSVPLPHPNGFDFDVKAEKALVKPDDVEDAFNAAQRMSIGHLSPPVLAADDALIQENDTALRLVRAGFAYPTIVPQPRSENPLFEYDSKIRRLARLLAFQARVRAAHGDWNGAASSAMDAIQLGENLPRGGVQIDWLVGLACQAIGRKPLWEILPHLTETQARANVLRLESVDLHFTSLADVMQHEKWMNQAMLLATFQHPDWRTAMTTDTFVGGGVIDSFAARISRIEFHIQLLKMGKKGIFDMRTRYLDAVIRSARAPYSAPVPIPDLPLDPQLAFEASLFDAREGGMPRPLGAFNGVQTITEDRLLEITLALRSYQLSHGQPPKNLQQLVPSIITRIPADPFALSGPLRYQRKGGTYLLYSVGPDGHDDHGTPVVGSVESDSRGDIVAGITK